MIVRKTYKVRLYPTKTQEQELLRTLAGCHFVWNHFRELSEKQRLENGVIPHFYDMAQELTQLRKSAPELIGIQRRPVEQCLRRLFAAYKRFYSGKGGIPRVKHSEDMASSFEKHRDWYLKEDHVCLQNNLHIKMRGTLPPQSAKVGTIIVKYQARSKWYASILVQEDIKLPTRHTAPIGVDVGLSSLAITSKGEKFQTLKPSYDLHAERHKLQRQLARQEIGSKRREKTLIALARLQHRIANVRMNHLHQTTSAILKKNPSMVAIEDLNVKGMVKNRRLARSLHDVSLGEFFRQIEYKTKWRGGEVVKINRFFPSTKTCSKCGEINDNMTLATRNWTCLGCGAEHDRDINAAKNILQQAMAEVRPA